MASPVVLVTGASRGIGRAIALEFIKQHYKVGINYFQSDEKASALFRETSVLGNQSLLLKADIGDSFQVEKMVQRIMDRWGRIDVLINNAGVTRDRTILKMTDEEWIESIRINLSGAFWCLRACAKIMAKQKEGSIVNLSSISGVRGSFGNANYSASKAGLIGLTKTAARELGRFDVRVNAVLPGFHLTDMGMKIPERYRESIKSEHALERFTDLNELAKFVLFLSRQKSASGQVYNFDSRVI